MKKTILAIETSCDETAVAVLRGSELLSSRVASQAALHETYGGVVPEVASRNHLLHAPRLLDEALLEGRCDLDNIDAFAATSGPGLASSLMIGASMAKGMAIGRFRAYLAINHLEGHLLSPFFCEEEVPRHIGLIASGGHTLLVEVRGIGDYKVIGGTLDDAAGEAFDKVAKMVGLGYPGGPEIERVAKGGNGQRFDLPRGLLGTPDHNFSFSGLKTAVKYLLPKIVVASAAKNEIVGHFCETPDSERRSPRRTTYRSLDDKVLSDLCASFQQAVVDVLVRKTIKAARDFKVNMVAVSGGVSCNRALREELQSACEKAGVQFVTAHPKLCTDNAAMIAYAAALRLDRGIVSDVTEEIDPNLALR